MSNTEDIIASKTKAHQIAAREKMARRINKHFSDQSFSTKVLMLTVARPEMLISEAMNMMKKIEEES